MLRKWQYLHRSSVHRVWLAGKVARAAVIQRACGVCGAPLGAADVQRADEADVSPLSRVPSRAASLTPKTCYSLVVLVFLLWTNLSR